MKNLASQNLLTAASDPNIPTNTELIAQGISRFGLLTTDVMATRELPDDLARIQELREAIDAKIFYDFANTRLSNTEQVTLTESGDYSLGKFDAYLLEAAQQYGARLLLSTLVMQRLWSWQSGEEGGADKLKALFHEIHRSALIGLHEAKGRVNDRYKSAKPMFVQEITVLQMQLREAFPETASDVRQFVDATIEASPESFPFLKTNKASLLLFLNDSRALAFRGSDFKQTKGDLTPAKFHAQWVAAATNRKSSESVRQDMSG